MPFQRQFNLRERKRLADQAAYAKIQQIREKQRSQIMTLEENNHHDHRMSNQNSSMGSPSPNTLYPPSTYGIQKSVSSRGDKSADSNIIINRNHSLPNHQKTENTQETLNTPRNKNTSKNR